MNINWLSLVVINDIRVLGRSRNCISSPTIAIHDINIQPFINMHLAALIGALHLNLNLSLVPNLLLRGYASMVWARVLSSNGPVLLRELFHFLGKE